MAAENFGPRGVATSATGRSVPPRRYHFAQLQLVPHLQDGPQLQVFGCWAHVQVGAQLQGLHLHFRVIIKLLWLRWWSSCDTVGIAVIIERSG